MSNKITKSTAGKFASDLERIYRDADGLSENDKRLIIDSYRKKIPGVANLVAALDQALVDDYNQ